MKINRTKSILTFATIAFMASAGISTASAGCLTGAAVGGVAGHGVLGAAAGCAIGHHQAEKRTKDAAQQSNQNQPR